MAAKSKSDKPLTNTEDINLLKSEVASFASSLGLSTSQTNSSGFNDVDFRKTKPKKQQPQQQKTPEKVTPQNNQKPNNKTFGKSNQPHENSKLKKPEPKPKPPVLSLNNDANKEKGYYNKFKNLPKLPLMKASELGVWFEDAGELEGKVIGEGKKVDVKNLGEWKGFVEKKRVLGERLMAQFAQDYESTRGRSSDIKMLISTQRSGTAADKVSAFSVLVGDNPVANLRSLDALLGMVTSKVGKRHALSGFEALQELFIASLLPDRKLKTLIQRPLNHIPETKDGHSLLLFWYWEECLKQRYERFVVALEEASRDMLPALKNKSLKTIYVLLSRKSEQERRLLSALVNKLGDPDNKAASNADYHLSNLLSQHPNMKAVVVNEVDSFLFRPHLGPRGQYHAVNFLSQLRLTNKGDGPKVAKRLIDVYFALFKVLITGPSNNQTVDKSGKENAKEKKTEEFSELHAEMDSRLLSALLTGVNRAFPFVSSDEADDIVDVQTPVLFQLVHSKNFNVGVQALMLLDKISSKNQIASDRFYRALYSKLLLPAAMNTSKAEMFIALILRAMKRDVNLKRVAAFSKRLLQIALQQPPQYACACLFLLSELFKARPPLWNTALQNESIDDELEHFEDVVEETDEKPVAVSNKPSDDILPVQNGDTANSDTDSSEGEDDQLASSEDDDDDLDDALEDGNFSLAKSKMKHKKSKSESDDEDKKTQESTKKPVLPGGYDPRHREPSYCNADRVSWWELLVLASHAHPSVATMARTLLSGANIVYNGNPLNDLSLTAFLDKFMEKKPKQTTWHGGSQIEPIKQMDLNNLLVGPEILSLAEVDVPPEDLVFHKFYTIKKSSSKPKKKKKKSTDEEDAADYFDADGDDDIDGGDESDNEEIEDLLDSADPTLGPDGDYDYDDLDNVANEDEDDLIGDVSDGEIDIGDVSDAEIDIPSDMEEDDADNTPFAAVDDDNDLDIGDIDDVEDNVNKRKRKRKIGGKSGASPFASYEEFEHILDGDDAEKKPSQKKNKSKKRKKKSGQ
ncbi:putative CCAAT-binding factor [Medicago truncatula]|uniref:CCAAT-binding factor n=1 Tax=Medicago truncatula TaxID=3880 RepID=G7KAU4_MEDTR|nr:CCAAT/enhancer-binding protein zeta [Medicago truncatula]AES94857.2 CCAAT-binding factor [Medicago truncatula]RHN54138.1 putative CCAAT-binding factor [Medicago truncatula]